MDHAVAAYVFRLFMSYSFERLLALHHGDGVRKAFQVFRQASLVCPLVEPTCQAFRILGGKLAVFRASSQLNYRSRPQDAVQVFVQENLGEALQYSAIELHQCPSYPTCLATIRVMSSCCS